MKKEVRYYSSLNDDFEASANQDYVLSDDYVWIREGIISKAISAFVYLIALVFSWIYCRLFLHMHIKNASVLRKAAKTGGFVYANHTQPVGDVFIPAHTCFPKRIYTIVSPANYGIPVIGKLLPYLGALPIPKSTNGIKKLYGAVSKRVEQKNFVVIYPEAHVWKYCNFIRPFSSISFKYPVKCRKPVFALTVTYVKRRFLKKPKMIVYVDGPFCSNDALSQKDQADFLRNAVYEAMQKRSALGNYEYISYKPKK